MMRKKILNFKLKNSYILEGITNLLLYEKTKIKFMQRV